VSARQSGLTITQSLLVKRMELEPHCLPGLQVPGSMLCVKIAQLLGVPLR
jgi:hypothetical protein